MNDNIPRGLHDKIREVTIERDLAIAGSVEKDAIIAILGDDLYAKDQIVVGLQTQSATLKNPHLDICGQQGYLAQKIRNKLQITLV